MTKRAQKQTGVYLTGLGIAILASAFVDPNVNIFHTVLGVSLLILGSILIGIADHEEKS